MASCVSGEGAKIGRKYVSILFCVKDKRKERIVL